MCKRDWERQKGEGARVSANECVSELATRAAGRRRGCGCRCKCRLRLTKVLGGRGLVVGWELGFGLVGLGADNQGKEGEGGKEGRELLAAPSACNHQCKCKYSCRTDFKMSQEGGRVNVCMWFNSASYSPKFCYAARAREDDTNRRTQRQREIGSEVRPLFFLEAPRGLPLAVQAEQDGRRSGQGPSGSGVASRLEVGVEGAFAGCSSSAAVSQTELS